VQAGPSSSPHKQAKEDRCALFKQLVESGIFEMAGVQQKDIVNFKDGARIVVRAVDYSTIQHSTAKLHSKHRAALCGQICNVTVPLYQTHKCLSATRGPLGTGAWPPLPVSLDKKLIPFKLCFHAIR
jgi:hypothetical protein